MSANKQVIREWVAALRSGEYPQGKGKLRKEVGDINEQNFEVVHHIEYCCLGVLTELCERSGNYEHDQTEELLPISVSLWAGFGYDESRGVPVNDPDIIHPGDGEEWTTLSALNDSGVDFNTIAYAIEKEWLA